MGKVVLLGSLFVRHHPSGYGNSKREESWKQAVADECRKHWGGRTPLERPVRVKLQFYLSRNRGYDLTGIQRRTL